MRGKTASGDGADRGGARATVATEVTKGASLGPLAIEAAKDVVKLHSAFSQILQPNLERPAED